MPYKSFRFLHTYYGIQKSSYLGLNYTRNKIVKLKIKGVENPKRKQLA